MATLCSITKCDLTTAVMHSFTHYFCTNCEICWIDLLTVRLTKKTCTCSWSSCSSCSIPCSTNFKTNCAVSFSLNRERKRRSIDAQQQKFLVREVHTIRRKCFTFPSVSLSRSSPTFQLSLQSLWFHQFASNSHVLHHQCVLPSKKSNKHVTAHEAEHTANVRVAQLILLKMRKQEPSVD